MRSIPFIIVLVVLPRVALAQVIISEFVYDAAGADSGQEWVELFNAGSASVDLTKWKLNDGSNHVLNVPPKNGGIGSIIIPSGGYLVLADDATAFESTYPSVANVVDTTIALPNTSGTVSLVDDSGTVVDSVSYTKDMGAAGDGNSLQRGSTSSSGVTAGTPTPGTGQLASSSAGAQDTGSTTQQQTDTQTQTQAKLSQTPSYVAPPTPSLFADAGEDRTVIVGADSQFDAMAYDKSKNVITANVRFSWNFGDGSTAEGESVLHHYSYPGRYAVVLNIAQDKFAGTDRVIVTAEPARLSFDTMPDGGVRVENLAGRDLDLSGWIVRAGHGLFPPYAQLPPHSIILSGSTMYITKETLGFAATEQAVLQYPNGMDAVTVGQTIGTIAPPDVPSVTTPTASTSIGSPSRSDPVDIEVRSRLPEGTDEAGTDPSAVPTVATSALVAAAGSVVSGDTLWWWGAAAALAAAAAATLFFARRIGADEWDITDATGEER